jgi:hypothetical protein
MLLKVMFGPLQVVVLFHIVKRLVMSIDELCQIFHFVFREHMLLYLVHDCCEGLQANPACACLRPLSVRRGSISVREWQMKRKASERHSSQCAARSFFYLCAAEPSLEFSCHAGVQR